jgi:PAS domain-containing protein
MVEHRWIRPDRGVRWVHLEINPRFDASGCCIGLFGTTQDITERRTSEDALKRAREQLIDAVESISEGFVLFDREDRYVLTNSKYREMYPIMADIFTPRSTYEAMVHTGIARGMWETDGDPEEFAKWHRAAS